MNPDVHAAIQPNGNLYDLGWYLEYVKGFETANLDGDFSADQLESIAAYMRQTQKEKSK